MSEHRAESRPEGRIFAVITRADGTVEDLGCISQFEPTDEDIAFMRAQQEAQEEEDGDGL